MALTKIRQDQVLNLIEEIEAIRKKAETFETPVATYAELPMEGNDQGDLRVCLEDGRIYIWKGTEWVVPEPNMDEKYSKTIFKIIDKQTTVVNTGVRLDGVGEYITNNKYVNVHLNGQLLMSGGDFEIEEVDSEIVLNFNYDLEPEDILAITYGAKIMIGTNVASASDHTHDNLNTLSKISEANGKMTFDGGTIGLANLSDSATDGIQMKMCNATGKNAAALGIGTTASGEYSLASGSGARATSSHSVCFGSGSESSGNYSFALGGGSTANKQYTIAMGSMCNATADYGVAIGNNASSTGSSSVALSASASGSNSFAACNNSQAKGSNSVAIGGGKAEFNDSIAIGNASTSAQGMGSVALSGGTASGAYSFAGLNATASGDFSLAFGPGTRAIGTNSIAIGGGCANNGQYSVAIGSGATINRDANNSVCLGSGSIVAASYGIACGNSINTTNVGEVGFGQFNATSADTALSIGNGTSGSARSNIFEIKSDGSILSSKLSTDDKDIVGALNTLLVSTQSYSTETTYEELKTNDKTIVGAINELYDMIIKL